VLEEHANGVRAAREHYNERMGIDRTAGRSFVKDNFPHLSELDERFIREEGTAYTHQYSEEAAP
jgi:hypothetical protein